MEPSEFDRFSKLNSTDRVSAMIKTMGIFPFVLVFAVMTAFPLTLFMYLQVSKDRETEIKRIELAVVSLRGSLRELDRTDFEIRDIAQRLTSGDGNVSKDELLRNTVALQRIIGDMRNVILESSEVRRRLSESNSGFSLISEAVAQTPPVVTSPATSGTAPPPAPARRISDEMRMWVMILVFAVLGLTFLISIVAIFKTGNAEVLKFAFDTVKTLLGFFIGVATTLIGTT